MPFEAQRLTDLAASLGVHRSTLLKVRKCEDFPAGVPLTHGPRPCLVYSVEEVRAWWGRHERMRIVPARNVNTKNGPTREGVRPHGAHE